VRIHAFSTGTVRLTDAFLRPRQNWRRQPDLLVWRGSWSAPMPIHCWAIEHEGRLILVDTGETAEVRDIPFAKFQVGPGDELPAVTAAAGLTLSDVDTVVLTHMHGDHMDGAVHVRGPVLVHGEELAFTRSAPARVMSKLLRQPVPSGVDWKPFALDGGPFGAFPRSRPLTDDGRVVAVDTAGHSPGHVSIVCIEDDGRHVMLAGDTTDSLEQLRALRADAVAQKAAVHVATMRRILEHGREHPTVYLPSHDPETATRLADRTTL
jgi:glyoxylase-like metal-dependent hydrolase (beta-lactamase superfamily II)